MSIAPVLVCRPVGRIILVERDAPRAASLRAMLCRHGYHVVVAATPEEALHSARTLAPAIVLSSGPLALADGTPLGEAIAQAEVKVTLACIEDADTNLDIRPAFDERTVLTALERALGPVPAPEPEAFAGVVGDSPELHEVCETMRRAAPTGVTVLVLGESGTGKELMAEALHTLSPRRDRPFVKVNCGALTETLLESELFGHEKGAFTGAHERRIGRFELADGGTLFLDEIGDISPATQVKLLRVLQSREFERVGGTKTLKVDVRVVAATNRDLTREVREGRFREDLFFRLNVVSVTLPPLRDRRGDIPTLAMHFLARLAARYGKPVRNLAPGTLRALVRYEWPGNVRELENVLERAVVLGRYDELTIDDLPPHLQKTPRENASRSALMGMTLYEIEREAILGTLQAVGGSTAGAAELLGISIRKVQYRLNEYAGLAPTRRPAR